ncbi:hypothetical protein A2U01_0070950, partial [Trifolium medium]|nr:hypothetical protein [Trifolium medium]
AAKRLKESDLVRDSIQ